MDASIKTMHTRKGFVAQVIRSDTGQVLWQSKPVRNPETGAEGRVINGPEVLARRAAETWLAAASDDDLKA